MLTQAEIDEMIATVEAHPFLCNDGTHKLGPLEGAPGIEADIELKPFTMYELNGDEAASFLVKNCVKVTIKTRNITKGMELLDAFKLGDNMLATERSRPLTLVPITETAAKTITFPNSFLQPGLSMTLGERKDPSMVQLVYICRPDIETGKPWVYGEGE